MTHRRQHLGEGAIGGGGGGNGQHKPVEHFAGATVVNRQKCDGDVLRRNVVMSHLLRMLKSGFEYSFTPMREWNFSGRAKDAASGAADDSSRLLVL